MMGITKRCADPDLAWELARHMYYNPEELADTFRELNILPPLREAWSRPSFAEPRPYWSDQPVGNLYAALADQVPPQYTSPFVLTAKSKMSQALTGCTAYYRAHGDEGFPEFVRATLKRHADEVRVSMGRNPF